MMKDGNDKMFDALVDDVKHALRKLKKFNDKNYQNTPDLKDLIQLDDYI